jgi:predicted  nucleic acid-binding Zn-ribbon protein
MTNDLEIKMLKETILALREELEKIQHEEREHVQQAVAEVNAQNRQLRASIGELRDQLELREAEHEAKMQSLRLQHQHELAELRQTIAALRAKLEELNESSQRTAEGSEAAAARTSH